jgi:hypothetical protein
MLTRLRALRVLSTLCSVWACACGSASHKHTSPNLAAGHADHDGSAGRSAVDGGTVQVDSGTSGGAGDGGIASDAGAAGSPAQADAAQTAGAIAAGSGAAAQAGGGGQAGDASRAGAGGQAGDASGAGGLAGTAGAAAGSGGVKAPPGLPRFCLLPPPNCEAINTVPFAFQPCCLESNACGYELSRPAELRDTLTSVVAMGDAGTDGTCIPADKMFVRAPGQDEKRVVTQGAPDQLITPTCESRALIVFPLVGCCMPNNMCGISTYQITQTLAGLTLFPAPFGSPECVSSAELKTQFRAAGITGLGQLPATEGGCDYAELDARLPHPDPTSTP